MNESEETLQILPSSQLGSLNQFYSNDYKSQSSMNILEMSINKDKDKQRFYNKLLRIKYKKLGNTIIFCFNSIGEPFFLIGPHCNNYISQ